VFTDISASLSPFYRCAAVANKATVCPYQPSETIAALLIYKALSPSHRPALYSPAKQGPNNIFKGKYLCTGKQNGLGNSATTTTRGPVTSITGSSNGRGSGGGASGLSSGAKAGIGIGIALVYIAALAALYLYFRHRRRSRNKHIMEGSDLPELSAREKKMFES
jgi:hypothetical protein